MKNEILHEKVNYKTVRELIEDVGEKYKGKTAYTFRIKPSDSEPVRVPFEQLRDEVRALGTELALRGYNGKHCAVIGKLSYSWIRTYFAVLSVGAVLVPLDRDWGGAELIDTMKNADVDCLFCDTDVYEKLKESAGDDSLPTPVFMDGDEGDTVEALVEAGKSKFSENSSVYFDSKIDVNAMSLLVFTSGTTGKGKGVMLSQKNILTDMDEAIQYMAFSDKAIAALPPHHTYGSSVTILGQCQIGCDVYISSGIRYIQKEIKEHKPGHLVLVPLYLETFYRKILANVKDQGKEKTIARAIKLSNALRKVGIDIRRKLFGSVLAAFGGELTMLISGGAYISQEIIDFYEAIGIQVLNGYGITECAPIIAVNHSLNNIHGSVGPVLDIDTLKIANPNEDGEGEICVKGSNVMLGYYKDPETTAEAFDEEGYFKTGDYGKVGKGGALFITGRKKNLIILSNGKNVYPEEIEVEFVAVPGVIDIVVYEGQSKQGTMHNAIVAEIYPDYDFIEKNKIEDPKKYFQKFVNDYNRNAVPYKKIGLLKVRTEEFPKNTLRKIMRFKIDMTID